MARKALGRGLDALLATDDKKAAEDGRREAKTSEQKEKFMGNELPMDMVKLEEIEPNPDQPRSEMDKEALGLLAESISAQGILQPLLVTKKPEGGYYLIAGERRWQAAKLAGLELVPVLVREVTSDDRLVLALIENVQRQDLNVLEEASAYRRLMEEYQFTQEKVAAAVGRDRATVANLLRLLRLPEAVQSDVLANRLTMGHARALLSLQDDTAKLLNARNKVLTDSLSVRQTEKLVERLKNPDKPKIPPKAAVQMKAEEDRLRRKLGTKVSITKKGKTGRIIIEFYSNDELETIISRIKGA